MLKALHNAFLLLFFWPLALTFRITSLGERLIAWGAGVWLGLVEVRCLGGGERAPFQLPPADPQRRPPPTPARLPAGLPGPAGRIVCRRYPVAPSAEPRRRAAAHLGSRWAAGAERVLLEGVGQTAVLRHI